MKFYKYFMRAVIVFLALTYINTIIWQLDFLGPITFQPYVNLSDNLLYFTNVWLLPLLVIIFPLSLLCSAFIFFYKKDKGRAKVLFWYPIIIVTQLIIIMIIINLLTSPTF